MASFVDMLRRLANRDKENHRVRILFSGVVTFVLALLSHMQCVEAKGGRIGGDGYASWYGGRECHGHRTASGARLLPSGFTAAHRFWPFGTRVRVTNHQNGRSVVVTINDRGPFVNGRVIDLSLASARAIGMSGVARVSLARL